MNALLSFGRLFTFLSILTLSGIYGQTTDSGDLETFVFNIISNMPATVGSNDYLAPSGSELTNWSNSISYMLSGDYSSAHSEASLFNYKVVEYNNTGETPNKTYYLLEKTSAGTNYWGTFILNPVPDRCALFVQIPHPKNDFNTGKQGFFIFREIGARAFILSGTHRCNNSNSSSCSGTTTVCSGSSESFKISDQAHVVDGTFQKTTEVLKTGISNLAVIQPHGFTKLEADPDVIMSNGIQSALPPTDYLTTLKTNLLVEDNTLTFKIAHIDTDWSRLIALTNTQGRLINEVGSPCSDNATSNTGLFLHLEQAQVKLRETESDWTKMSNALAATFPENPLPVELANFSGRWNESVVELTWVTETEVNNYGFEIERKTEGNDWNNIGFIEGHGNSNSPKEYSFTDKHLIGGSKFFYRLKQIDNDGKFAYSDEVEVEIIPDEFALYQNYPNPFNPNTKIRYQLPQESKVIIKLYDILGSDVITLLNEQKEAGVYEVDFNAQHLSSGTYIYRIVAGSFIETKKMVLLR
jgi:hypothetical protein